MLQQHCPNCGAQLNPGGTFCENCGAPVAPVAPNPSGGRKSGGKLTVIIVIICAVVVLGAAAFFIFNNFVNADESEKTSESSKADDKDEDEDDEDDDKDEDEDEDEDDDEDEDEDDGDDELSADDYLKSGNRNLRDGDNEAAITAFENAIRIDGKFAEAYIALAKTYIALERTEDAMSILQQGLDKTKDKEIAAMLDELEQQASDEVDAAWKDAYFAVLRDTVTEYGLISQSIIDNFYDFSRTNGFSGKYVEYAELLDFENDGTPELTMIYSDGNGPVYSVYRFDSNTGKAVHVTDDSTHSPGSTDVSFGVVICTGADGKHYKIAGSESEIYEYYTIVNGKWTLAPTVKESNITEMRNIYIDAWDGVRADLQADIINAVLLELNPSAKPFVLPPEPANRPSPESYSQKVVVTSSGSDALMELYEWGGQDWILLLSTTAKVGVNGVGWNYGDGKKITPQGTYNILFCYGLSYPMSGIRFKQLRSGDVFVDDSNSVYYNMIVNSSYIAAGVSRENTYKQFSDGIYTTNIFFDYNGDGETPGSSTGRMGSVYTVCGVPGTLKATAGCIDIKSGDMSALLSYLDASKNPCIIIN